MRLTAAHEQSLPVSNQKTNLAQEKALKESPKDQPENSLFVANSTVEYSPNPKIDTKPTVVVALREADKPETESAPVLADLAPDSEEKLRVSELSREMETRPATPGINSPQNHPEVVLANLAVKKTWDQNRKQVGIIRVEVEETLGHYAEWLNVPAREIRRLNGFRYGRALHLNQKIKIPLHRVTREEFVEKRFEHHQELAEDFFASYRVERVMTYSIKKGDNIWTLSYQEFEVPLWLIKRYNAGVDFSALIPSQKLLIPIIEKNV
jgi:membrane-bound lytic murein transglycosylase D